MHGAAIALRNWRARHAGAVRAAGDYPTHRPLLALRQVWEGKGVVASARKLIGATNPLASEPGTIRGDFAIEVGRNVIHGSDSPENGEREAGEWPHWCTWCRGLPHPSPPKNQLY